MTTALIIGAGHNGLVCAFYLAAAGIDVTIVERRDVVGGAAVTEEFHPGFRNSTASYTVSLLQQKVIDDLDLYAHGLKIVERAAPNFWPLGNEPGAYLKNAYSLEETQKEFARHSEKDAAALPGYYAAIEMAADVLRELVLETPPNLGAPLASGGWRDVLRALKTGNRFRRLSVADQQMILDLFTKSAAEFLAPWFENDAIRAGFAFDGIVGAYASPHTPGTAYVLLHHVFGNIGGRPGFWGHAIGGMGAVTQAMARAAEARGVKIRTGAPVRRLIVDGGRAVGVKLEDGEELRADLIAANVNPKLLFRELAEKGDVPSAFANRMAHYACGSGT
ncbi:MAG: NAD(P)/FAD-dependent oxidoreductase, partial [Pseudomonadota bacterium]